MSQEIAQLWVLPFADLQLDCLLSYDSHPAADICDMNIRVCGVWYAPIQSCIACRTHAYSTRDCVEILPCVCCRALRALSNVYLQEAERLAKVRRTFVRCLLLAAAGAYVEQSINEQRPGKPRNLTVSATPAENLLTQHPHCVALNLFAEQEEVRFKD